MTPAARIAAAIDILDRILVGAPAEKELTTWGRKNRYAGSGDRAAVRDHVFDALRCKRSYAWLGGLTNGQETTPEADQKLGRPLMLGALRAAGQDPAEVFTGTAYSPDILSEGEMPKTNLADAPKPVQLDMPDWLFPELEQSLGRQLDPVLQALRQRAPVFLRVNLAQTDIHTAQAALAEDDILTSPHALSNTALEVTQNPRRISNSRAYKDGLVELQDVSSQAVVDALPQANRVLDYCAGGGGKSLALAARADANVFAHDVDEDRMRDIPLRANRAGVDITELSTADLKPKGYDLVFCDAPCSGSGSWRRAPDAKWRLTAERLQELHQMQCEILERAKSLVAPGGALAYATCSILDSENAEQVSDFNSKNPDWTIQSQHQFSPQDGGDGFYVAILVQDRKHA